MTESAQPEYVLDQGRRLSESMLWRLPRGFYDQHGINAWSHGNAPQGITTTPHIARAYTRILLGYLRDMQAQLDRSQRVYVVELGAGSGRFGYRFVKHLSRLIQRSSFSGTPFTYVMTDAAPSLIDYWQNNPSLRPLRDAGILDFALFDATRRDTMQLVNSGLTLDSSAVANPMIVLANYVFDSIPQDSFGARDGQLFENLVKVTSHQPEPDLSQAQLLQDLGVSFEQRPLPSSNYYPEPELNHVLDGYRRLRNGMVLFPAHAMRCMRYFQELSANRVLFVIGDLGSTREVDVEERGSRGGARAGFFWLDVNFHALGEYVRELGGHVFHPPHRHFALNVSAFVLGNSSTVFRETELAFYESVAENGSDDFYFATRLTPDRLDSMSLDEVLAFLRLTGFDSEHVARCVPRLLELVKSASAAEREEVSHAVEEAWEMFYPVEQDGDAGDLAFFLGAVLFTLEDYPRALDYFQRSLELFGPHVNTTFNIALSFYRMRDLRAALEWLERTLELDPSSERGQEMRSAIQSEIA